MCINKNLGKLKVAAQRTLKSYFYGCNTIQTMATTTTKTQSKHTHKHTNPLEHTPSHTANTKNSLQHPPSPTNSLEQPANHTTNPKKLPPAPTQLPPTPNQPHKIPRAPTQFPLKPTQFPLKSTRQRKYPHLPKKHTKMIAPTQKKRPASLKIAPETPRKYNRNPSHQQSYFPTNKATFPPQIQYHEIIPIIIQYYLTLDTELQQSLLLMKTTSRKIGL